MVMEDERLDTHGMHSVDPMCPAPFRIIRRYKEIHDTFTMELEPADGNGFFSFSPGQFNMLYAFGVGESAISISGDPDRVGEILEGAVGKGLDGITVDLPVNGHKTERIELLGEIANKILR